MAIGGALGGCLAYMLSEGKFKPVSRVIMYEMREEDRQQLVNSVSRILSELDASDGMQLLILLNGNAALKSRVISEMTNFFQHQLSMAVL